MEIKNDPLCRLQEAPIPQSFLTWIKSAGFNHTGDPLVDATLTVEFKVITISNAPPDTKYSIFQTLPAGTVYVGPVQEHRFDPQPTKLKF